LLKTLFEADGLVEVCSFAPPDLWVVPSHPRQAPPLAHYAPRDGISEGPRGTVSQRPCGVMPAWCFVFYCLTGKIGALGERALLVDCVKNSRIARFRKSRKRSALAISAAARLRRIDSRTSDRFAVVASFTSRRERPTSGPENFQSSAKKDFCNKTLQEADIVTAGRHVSKVQRAALLRRFDEYAANRGPRLQAGPFSAVQKDDTL
jgi:hypothetical protein